VGVNHNRFGIFALVFMGPVGHDVAGGGAMYTLLLARMNGVLHRNGKPLTKKKAFLVLVQNGFFGK